MLSDLRLRLPDLVGANPALARRRSCGRPRILRSRQFIRGEPDGPVRFHYPAPPIDKERGFRHESALNRFDFLAKAVNPLDLLARLGAGAIRLVGSLGHASMFFSEAGAPHTAAIRRFDLSVVQIYAIGNLSLGDHHHVRGGGRRRCWRCRPTMRWTATAPPSRSACWWRCRCCASSARC